MNKNTYPSEYWKNAPPPPLLPTHPQGPRLTALHRFPQQLLSSCTPQSAIPEFPITIASCFNPSQQSRCTVSHIRVPQQNMMTAPQPPLQQMPAQIAESSFPDPYISAHNWNENRSVVYPSDSRLSVFPPVQHSSISTVRIPWNSPSASQSGRVVPIADQFELKSALPAETKATKRTPCQKRAMRKEKKMLKFQAHYDNVILPENPVLHTQECQKKSKKLSSTAKRKMKTEIKISEFQIKISGLEVVVAQLEKDKTERDVYISKLQEVMSHHICDNCHHSTQLKVPIQFKVPVPKQQPLLLEPLLSRRKTNHHRNVWQTPLFVGNTEVAKSIKPKQWLTTSALLTVMWMIIRRYDLTESVFLCAPAMTQHVANRCYDLMALLCAKYHMGKYKTIVLPLNLQEVGAGTHWLLGGIAPSMKAVYIADSMDTSIADLMPSFRTLLMIAGAMSSTSGVPICGDEWSMHLATDAAKQDNFYDCGLHVCQNMEKFVSNRHPTFDPNATRDRIWLSELVQSFDEDALSDYNDLLHLEIDLDDREILHHFNILEHLDSFCMTFT